MSDIQPGSYNPRALRPGSKLPSYTIERVLGAGGFGITYLARHNTLSEKLVAIKEYMPKDSAYRNTRSVIKLETESHREQFELGLDSFFQEAKNLYRLTQGDHPCLANIVHVDDVFRHNNTAYMVMQYVEGDSLETLIQHLIQQKEETGTRLPEERIRSIFGQLGSALAFIHRQQLLHRDITPSNVIVRHADQRPVLIDFGSAKSQAGHTVAIERGSSASTAHTRIVFTPGYAPLEQSEGIEQDARTDVYGLAATMYHLTLLTKPVPAQARRGEQEENRPDPMPAAAVAGAAFGYADELLATIDAGLKLRMHERPDDVERWLTPSGILAPAAVESLPPPAALAPREPARSRWPTGNARRLAVGAIAATLVAAVIWFASQPTRAELIASARDAIAAAPFDTQVLQQAQDRFAAAQADAPEMQKAQATAGRMICDQLLAYRDHTDQRDVAGAGANLAQIKSLAQRAGFPDAFTQRLDADFRFESGLQSMTELLRRTALGSNLAPRGTALLDSMRTAGEGRPRFVAAAETLARTVSAAAQLGNRQFAGAHEAVRAASQRAPGIGFGPVAFAPAIATIDAQRSDYVQALNDRAARALSTTPADLQSLADIATSYEEVLRVDPGNRAAVAGQSVATALRRLADDATAGPVAELLVNVTELQAPATTAGLDDDAWGVVLLTYQAIQQRRRLEQAQQVLQQQPLAEQTLATVDDIAATVISDVQSLTLETSLADRASELTAVTTALREVRTLQVSHDYAAAQSNLSALVAARPTFRPLADITATANALVGTSRTAEIERRWTAALTSFNRWRLPGPWEEQEAALAHARLLAPDEPRVDIAATTIAQFNAVATAATARRFEDAFNRLEDAAAASRPLSLDTSFHTDNLAWLRDQASAQADRNVAAAFALISKQPLAASAHAQAEELLTGADQLVRLTTRAQPETGTFRQTLAALGQIPEALQDGAFRRASELAELAVAALPADRFDRDVLHTPLSQLISTRKDAFLEEAAATVAGQVESIRKVLADAPVDLGSLQTAKSLLDTLAPLRANPEVTLDWSLVADVGTVLGALTQARNLADSNRYLAASTLLVETSVAVGRNAPWRALLQQGVSALEQQKTTTVAGLLREAGERLFATPFEATAWDLSGQQYQRVQVIEASAEGLGVLGTQFVELLRRIAEPVTTEDFAWMQGEGRTLSKTARNFARLPAGLKTLLTIAKDVDGRINRQVQQAQASLDSLFVGLSYDPDAPTTYDARLEELGAIRAAANAKSLDNIVAIADALRPRLERLQQASQRLQTRHYEAAKTIARQPRSGDQELFSEQQRTLLSKAEQTMRTVSTTLAARAQVRSNQALIRAFDALAEDGGGAGSIRVAKTLVAAVLVDQVDFPDGLTTTRFLDLLESGTDCASRTRGAEILSALNYPFNVAWFEQRAADC